MRQRHLVIRTVLVFLLSLSVSAICGTGTGRAAESDWSTFVETHDGRRVCWAVTPAREDRDTLLYVWKHRGDARPEIYLLTGKRLQPARKLRLVIGQNAFRVTSMVRNGAQEIWIQYRSDANKAVTAMKAAETAPGSSLFLAQEGKPLYTFSAIGFSRAFDFAMAKCG
ncbi:hypothetical protein KU6B_03630 [Mameliella alba]|uniref:hypothetical protein n=1 Tax=Mameliella alba TaxID=561184 RepID=UPI0013E48929|nr:hypothetical protein [Mameliella alba]BBU54098.1 hypothetical protein KU6B_03630 [Mameliella alba]